MIRSLRPGTIHLLPIHLVSYRVVILNAPRLFLAYLSLEATEPMALVEESRAELLAAALAAIDDIALEPIVFSRPEAKAPPAPIIAPDGAPIPPAFLRPFTFLYALASCFASIRLDAIDEVAIAATDTPTPMPEDAKSNDENFSPRVIRTAATRAGLFKYSRFSFSSFFSPAFLAAEPSARSFTLRASSRYFLFCTRSSFRAVRISAPVYFFRCPHFIPRTP